MDDIDERVAEARACRHNLWHYLDSNGNRRCSDCRAFVRPIEGVAICKAPEDGDAHGIATPIVRVYTAGPACQACTLTKRHLDRIGVPYTEVPIGKDALVVDAMKFCDFTRAPVVCASVNGEELAWDGYRPDRLDALRGAA